MHTSCYCVLDLLFVLCVNCLCISSGKLSHLQCKNSSLHWCILGWKHPKIERKVQMETTKTCKSQPGYGFVSKLDQAFGILNTTSWAKGFKSKLAFRLKKVELCPSLFSQISSQGSSGLDRARMVSSLSSFHHSSIVEPLGQKIPSFFVHLLFSKQLSRSFKERAKKFLSPKKIC